MYVYYGNYPKINITYPIDNLSYITIDYSGNTIATSSVISSGQLTDGSYTTPDLSFNTLYTFHLKPYKNGNKGIIKTVKIDTTPNISGIKSTFSTTSNTQIQWSSTKQYSYVKVSRALGTGTNATIGTYTDISNTAVLSPYYDNDISGNTTYSYKITPYIDTISYTPKYISLYTTILSAADLSATFIDSSAISIQFTPPKNSYNNNVYYILRVLNTTYTTYKDVSSSLSPLFVSDLSISTTHNCSIITVLDGTQTATYPVLSVTTLPIIQNFAISVKDSSSVTLTWNGIYTSAIIGYATGLTQSIDIVSTDISTQKTTQILNLIANASYIFTITPYSGISGTGTVGTAQTSSSVITLGNISNFSAVVSGTSINLSYTYTASKVKIYYGTTSNPNANNTGDLTSSSIIINSLTANTQYFFTIYPYNSNSEIGIPFPVISAATDTNITFVSNEIIDNSSIKFTYTGNYTYIIIKYGTSSGTGNAIYNKFLDDPSTTATIYDLSSNTKYYFNIYPINSSLVEGTKYITELSGTTYGILTTLYTAAYYDTSAIVAFDGSFTSLDISTNGITTTYTTARNTGLDISGLIPGSTYIVTTNVRNSAGVAVAGNTISFTTLSKITAFTATAIDSSSISVGWSVIGDISYVSLIWNTTGSSYNATTDSSGSYTTSPINITGLILANTQYYFQITPISDAGSGYTKYASNVTYGTLTTLYTAAFYDTSAIIAFDGSFTSIDISINNITRTYTTARNTGLDISGLTPGATYKVTTNVRNSAGVAVAGNTIYFITFPKITTAIATTFDISSISIDWTSIGATSVNIIWNTTGGIYSNSDSSNSYYNSPALINSLIINTKYYFRVIPVGTEGNGYPFMDISATISIPTDYICRLNGTSLIVPTKDTTNTYTITNNNVVMINNISRGYVFYNSANNALSVNVVLSSNTSFTRCFWFYFINNSGDSNNNSVGSPNVPIYKIGTSTTFAGVNFSSGQNLTTFSTSSNINVWTHLAVVWNQTNYTYNVFKNGSLVATSTFTNLKYLGDSKIYLFEYDSLTGTQGFRGYLDDIMIFNRALSSNEILYIYNSTK